MSIHISDSCQEIGVKIPPNSFIVKKLQDGIIGILEERGFKHETASMMLGFDRNTIWRWMIETKHARNPDQINLDKFLEFFNYSMGKIEVQGGIHYIFTKHDSPLIKELDTLVRHLDDRRKDVMMLFMRSAPSLNEQTLDLIARFIRDAAIVDRARYNPTRKVG